MPQALHAIARRTLLMALATPALARAQAPAWPDRPVRLVVPFGAGGAIDTLSRTVANAFPPLANGQTLVVENRGGAGGTIAGAVVAQARPDGATLMMADLGANAIARDLQPSLSYDPMRAFTPICHLVNLPLVLVVPAASPARDLAGLLDLARQRRDLVYAHPGIGYVGHLAQELLLRRTGVTMTPVPYRSGAEVVRSIIADETGSAIITVSTTLPFIREGKVRALAVAARERVPLLPDVPTIAEAGGPALAGFEATVWHGVLGPAGLPEPLVEAANRVFNAAMRQPDVARVVEQTQAGQIVGGTPAQFANFIQAEHARWAPLIQSAGIRTE
ncbi:Tripartite-type tricarboxylate transporter, receptor component TctC [Belnapia rosea]|uniref:Tripartite-type tricarboxylate transporter, receptor component TctC n=2 Tax=Belnapia rosea TaxID=938405 RepID=A0A1G6XXK3_9PROT|nr:Tripartite-type tricarboxylate transporter, receptor component TctC [Belnapia rosea]SDD82954.1 Tripartite-type tricarboxylate transporter, receptor component TctC [Belnapia rosea]